MTGRHARLSSLLERNHQRLKASDLRDRWSQVGVPPEALVIPSESELPKSWPAMERSDFTPFEDIAAVFRDFAPESPSLVIGEWPQSPHESSVRIDRAPLLRALPNAEEIFPFGFAALDEASNRVLFVLIDFDPDGWFREFAIKEI